MSESYTAKVDAAPPSRLACKVAYIANTSAPASEPHDVRLQHKKLQGGICCKHKHASSSSAMMSGYSTNSCSTKVGSSKLAMTQQQAW